MTPRSVLLTGVTGFVGGAIALDLLSETDATLYCLTRAQDPADATRRLHAQLRQAASLYDRTDLLPDIERRCHALHGDLASPDQLPDLPTDDVDLVIHAAACLKYAEKDAAETHATNVEGTRSIVKLTERIGASRLAYISTAYVAGRREGLIREDDPLADPAEADRYNNAYERSKAAAEQVVRDAPVETQILRPGIVIGHSRTGATVSATGYYTLLRGLGRLRRRAEGQALPPIRILANPEFPVGLIPVDLVSRATVRIALTGPAGRVFHLTNSAPPTLGTAFRSGFRYHGLPEPLFTTDPADLSPLEVRMMAGFFDAYTATDKTFEVSNTESVCGVGAMAHPMDEARFRYFEERFFAKAG